MPVGDGDHSLEALRKERVVRVNDFAVLGRARKHAKRAVPVRDDGQELAALLQPYSRISLCVRADDLGCPVRAAVVDDDVLPRVVGLGEHALDALGEIPLAVVDRRHHPHQRAIAHGPTTSHGA